MRTVPSPWYDELGRRPAARPIQRILHRAQAGALCKATNPTSLGRPTGTDEDDASRLMQCPRKEQGGLRDAVADRRKGSLSMERCRAHGVRAKPDTGISISCLAKWIAQRVDLSVDLGLIQIEKRQDLRTDQEARLHHFRDYMIRAE